MNTSPLKITRRKNSGHSMIAILMASLGLLLASPVSALAQELFVLSTETGLELYQVEKLITPNGLLNTYRSAVQPKAEAVDFRYLALHSAYRVTGKPLFVNSGLQTTPNGRLTMAGPIDWEPSVDDNAFEDGLVASLFPNQLNHDLASSAGK